MSKNEKKIELLAPAGNIDALHAAVCAGADAVYLGLDNFNARRGADNFTIVTLKNACDYAHLRGVKIYLTLNIIIFESEFDEVMQLAYDAADAGVDAFIVQDIGLATTIAKEIPHVGLHISTQMNVHDEAGLFAVAEMGAKRVTLAREMAIEEIENLCRIANKLNIEIECFGHGALCICYSGQCMFSSMIGGRSANRGTCAQACRLNYELKQGKWSLGNRRNFDDDKRGSYLLSPKDLCTIEILPKLAIAGISSLKIEGRMKSASYVFEVVSVYRQAINRMYEQGFENYSVYESETARLKEAFSRGFSTAYLEGRRGNEIMSYSRPNNRGLNIGRVSGITSNKVYISSKYKLALGDVLEIWTKHGRSTIKFDKNTKVKEDCYEFIRNPKDLSLKNVSKSDRVFRVKSAENEFHAEQFEPRVEIECKLILKINKRANITVWKGNSKISIDGEIVESARTKAVTKDEVSKHINRLGQTPFKMKNLEIILDDNVGISFSKLHHLRSEALNRLEESILCTNFKKLGKRKSSKSNASAKKTLDLKVFDSSDLFDTEEFCESLGHFYTLSKNGISAEIGPHLPVVNRASIDYFKNHNVKRIWLSPEMSIKQIKNICSYYSDMSFGLYIIGPAELMITRHCVLMSEGECKQNCRDCNRRQKDHYLLDRVGYEFPVITDPKGNTHIYNSVSLDVCHAIDELKSVGVDSFLVDTTLMNSSQANQAIKRAKNALVSNVDKPKDTTTGHLFREVF